MNLPNILTVSRVLLTFIFMLLVFAHGLGAKASALAVFVIASFTDLLDGYFAKRNNQITDFGRLMDPIADKILILSALLAFVEMKIIPAWMVLAILFRELAVTGLRLFALTQHRVIPADGAGKQKTVLQVVSVFAILLYIIFREGGPEVFGFWTGGLPPAYLSAIYFLMAITVILTLLSGISYLIRNREVYSNAKKD
jgi:CDP-diacylglycerol--glycerol-3-phosphate 3-phosphatidyltransferase